MGVMRVHLLVKDAAGPIHSGPAGPRRFGTKSRWRFACDTAREAIQEHGSIGTTLPWAVRCPGCQASPEYAAVFRGVPKPGGGARGNKKAMAAAHRAAQEKQAAQGGGCCR